MEATHGRRSVRACTAKPVDPVTIRALLASAVRSPTAVHLEPWAFAIVKDRDTLKSPSARAKPLFLEDVRRAHLDRGGHASDSFARPEFDIFYEAGTLIVICGTSTGPLVEADCWLSAENRMPAAGAMELGTCVIGSAGPRLNTDQVKRELGIAADGSAIVPIVVGTPADVAPATTRKEPHILTWLTSH